MRNNRSLFPPLFSEVPTGGGGGGSGNNNKIQLTELPEASLQYKDKIVQYIGETTDTLTNGYFYKCVEHTTTEGETITVTYSWDNVEVQPASLLTLEASTTTDGSSSMRRLFIKLFDAITLNPNKRYLFVRGTVTLYETYRTDTALSFGGDYLSISGSTVTEICEAALFNRNETYIRWYKNGHDHYDEVPSAGIEYKVYSYNL